MLKKSAADVLQKTAAATGDLMGGNCFVVRNMPHMLTHQD